MKSARPRFFLVSLFMFFLCFLVQPGMAEDTGKQRTTSLFIRFEESSEFTSEQQRLLKESILIRLGGDSTTAWRLYPYDEELLAPSAESTELQPRAGQAEPASVNSSGDEATTAEQSNPDTGKTELPLADLTLLDGAAALNGADSWLLVRIDGSMQNLQSDFYARDLFKRNTLFSRRINATVDSRFRNAFAGLWSSILDELHRNFVRLQNTKTLAISTQVGNSISVQSGQLSLLQTNASDVTTTLEVQAPGSFQVLVSSRGFRPKSHLLFVEDNVLLESKLDPLLPVWGRFSLQTLSFPDLQVALWLIPGVLDLHIGGVFYALGLFPTQVGEYPASVFRNFRQISPYLGSSFWFEGLGPQFGLGIQLDLCLNLLTQDTEGLNSLNPVSLRIGPRFQVFLIPELALDFLLSPQIHFSEDSERLQSTLSYASNRSFTNVSFYIPGLVIEPLTFSLGVSIIP